ncbi:MAG: YdcF family protein [Oscillospiraceae bacterium]|nr:YdcF family protein [Oscillospiraceae bacterium]
MNCDLIAAITDFIFARDELVRSDIIFMPGDSNPAVPEAAADLYARGLAPLVMPCGRFSVKHGRFLGVRERADIYDGDYFTECDFYSDVLRKRGVPDAAILREDGSGMTKENGTFARRVADGLGLTVSRAIVCCKSFHARRSQMVYALAFPDAEILVHPVDVYGVTRDNWHTTAYGVERVMGELARCGNQFTPELTGLLGLL